MINRNGGSTPAVPHSTQLDFLRQTGLFADFSETALTALVNRAVIEQAPKNKILFLSGETAKSFFVIINGWVKLFRETLDGTQAILDIPCGGGVFGETAIFHDMTYASSAEAVEDCLLLKLPLEPLKQLMERDGACALAMLKNMSRHQRQQDRELEHRALQSAPQRIGCFLLRLIPPQADKSTVLNLPYDKALLAARLGMQPETFSRALQRLKSETGLRVIGARVEIDDIPLLTRYACSACTAAYPCCE